MVGRPRSFDEPAPNRIREIRERMGISQAELARRIGETWDHHKVSRIESGKTGLDVRELEPIAAALGVSPAEILTSATRSLARIIGYVGAGAEVFPIEELPRWEGDYEVECPHELNPDDTEALIVEGDSMLPIEPRSTVFVTRSRPLTADDMLGKLCVVELADGRRLVKQVRRGYQRGRFNLISTNAAPIEDVEIERAARVRAIIPPNGN
jgi:transcriptional regulator with XRE-family HTH domain